MVRHKWVRMTTPFVNISKVSKKSTLYTKLITIHYYIDFLLQGTDDATLFSRYNLYLERASRTVR